MDEISAVFDSLKYSALSKSKNLNTYVRTVTIGPNVDDDYNKNQNLIITLSNPEVIATNVSGVRNTCNSKILAEAELQRRENVRKAVAQRAHIIAQDTSRRRKEVVEHLKHFQRNVAEQLLQQENALDYEKRSFEKQAHAEMERVQQFHKLQEKKRSETAQKLQHRQQEEQRQNDEKLVVLCTSFESYNANLLEKIRVFLQNLDDRNPSYQTILNRSQDVTNLAVKMETLIQNSQTQVVNQRMLNVATEHLNKMIDLSNLINNDISTALEYENTQSEVGQYDPNIEHVNNDNQNQIIKPISPPPVPESITNVELDQKSSECEPLPLVEQFVSVASMGTYQKLDNFCKNYENSYQNLLYDESLKKYRFDCQKAINMPINAITAVNGKHLMDKYIRLSNLLSGQTVEVGSIKVSTTKHPEALAYCTDLLARKFVRQGDLMVSSNPKSAFAFAAVIVALWTKYPDFGKLVLAHFYRECIYLVPMYLPRLEGQSDEDYYKSLGYKYIEHEVEEQDKFLKRMSGIVRLYSAVIVTNQRREFASHLHPHGLSMGWRWLCSILNLEPRVDITATVLYNFLEVAGNAMITTYGKQFQKVLRFICKNYFPRLEKIDTGGPVVRLQVFLQDLMKNGTVPHPEGLLPDNFW